MAERPERIVPEKYLGRNIYSISRLGTFENCKYSYYRQYHLKDRGKNNIYAILGEHIHSLLEELEIGKISNEDAVKEFDAKLLECEIFGYKFPTDKVKTNFTESIRLYLQMHKPINAKKILIEKEFYTEVSNAVFVGYIDVIAWMHDNSIEVIDYKTSTKYTKKDLDSHGYQLTLYAMALEKEYGIKINSVKWNLLKYASVKFMGATKPRELCVQRNELIKSLRSELLKDLAREGIYNLEAEILLEQAEKTNTLDVFSETIQNRYTIEDYYMEYPYNENTRKMLENYVQRTVAEIESTPLEESAWKGRTITTRDNFFCSVLCQHKSNCPYYQAFVEANPELFDKSEQEQDLITKIFG